MNHIVKLATCMELNFFDQIFWGYSWLLHPSQYFLVSRPPEQALGASGGLYFFFMNFENSPYYRLCKSNVALAVYYI